MAGVVSLLQIASVEAAGRSRGGVNALEIDADPNPLTPPPGPLNRSVKRTDTGVECHGCCLYR